MVNYNTQGIDSLLNDARARAQQMTRSAGMGSNFQYSQPTPPGFPGVGEFPGAQGWQGQPGVPGYPGVPNTGHRGQDGVNIRQPIFGQQQTWSTDPGRMSNGQSIEDLFNNPYGSQPELGYLEEELRRLQEAKRARGPQAPPKVGQKGDLRVIAGDRADGVKPREVRIDDANNYDTQKSENSYQDRRQEARFKDGTVGREYDVTVTWEDGTTTKKRVQLRDPGQIVYINSAHGF